MSRIGKQPVPIPGGVDVTVEGVVCRVKGPQGELTQAISREITIEVRDGAVVVTRPSDSPRHRALHGLTRALINNMVIGVTDGFRKSLEIIGTGYRAELQGQDLVLNVGYSHPVQLEASDPVE